ncbi:AfsR/SARP family transcriptional regulator [Candidatus Soleaferrea massiliensis]|uniref:AfsR/SARP family transcriptional regulator n=1 Tax=Candidatus Soleaferrea massiliensis TaxID=1470354 RepID=UPI00058B0A44|nr:BTAD domain-containing putative transcriptional regulator [Candidatus Soleaferrea massiliensis]
MATEQTDKTHGRNDVIEVYTLGGFSIRYHGNVLSENTGRTKKVWALIELLLANSGSDVSQEKLMEALWADEDCDNPLNALKNLVYRARNQLKSLLNNGDPAVDFIKFERNTYAWNPDLPCRVDVDEFEKLIREASGADLPDEEKLRAYRKAASLYKGQFLPKSSFMDWVIVKDAYYSSLYNQCVVKLVSLLMRHKKFEEAVQVCERAVFFSPFEEEIHQLLLCAYSETGQQKKVVEHYKRISETFYNEFGVNLAPETVQLYKKLMKAMHNVEMDLMAIKNDLRETDKKNGAFFCDYDIFKNIYRLQARTMLRTGYPVHIGLITFTDLDGELPPAEVIRQVMTAFREHVVRKLRRGDVIAAYSSTQYVIMLPMATYENCKKVIHRLVMDFEKGISKMGIKVSTMLHEIEPVETDR